MFSPPVLLGHPRFAKTFGPMLGFEFATPGWRFLDFLRWHVPIPRFADVRANPIGLKVGDEYLMQAKCPPYYTSMSDAVDAVVAAKFGPKGVYDDPTTFGRIYKGDYGKRYLMEAAVYAPEVVDCARDVCNYIFETHGRFPAHCDAMHVPGVWLQVHHTEHEYYERYFNNGLTDAHRLHHEHWHQAARVNARASNA